MPWTKRCRFLVVEEAGSYLSGRRDRFPSNSPARNDFMSVVRQTGRALAADRSTKFLPIIVAQIIFIAAVAIALFRTIASAGNNAQGDTLYDKLQAHSIAFSAQYFWIIPAVFLSSIVGVSQTEAAIPRILRRFQKDLVNLPVQMPNDYLEDAQRRILQGGVYSWQPASSIAWTSQPRPADKIHAWLPYPILLSGTLTGMLLSAFVPPDGFNCRHLGEISICSAWIVSALIDHLLNHLWPPADCQRAGSNSSTILLWATMAKDVVITCATTVGLVVMQIGIFNRCACYTKWGRVGLALLERPDVAATLIHRLNTVYPAITFTGIGIELVVVPLFFSIWYRDALRVFIQRDDRQSNAPAWLRNVYLELRATQQRLLMRYPHLRFGPWKLRRIGTARRASEEARGSHSRLSQGPHELKALLPRPFKRPAGPPADREPLLRRRHTAPKSNRGDDTPSSSRSPDNRSIPRKPVPAAAPQRPH